MAIPAAAAVKIAAENAIRCWQTFNIKHIRIAFIKETQIKENLQKFVLKKYLFARKSWLK